MNPLVLTHFISLKQKVRNKDTLLPTGGYKKWHIRNGPSEQVIWLGNSHIKWGIQSQITCSKALLQIWCRWNWGSIWAPLQGRRRRQPFKTTKKLLCNVDGFIATKRLLIKERSWGIYLFKKCQENMYKELGAYFHFIARQLKKVAH